MSIQSVVVLLIIKTHPFPIRSSTASRSASVHILVIHVTEWPSGLRVRAGLLKSKNRTKSRHYPYTTEYIENMFVLARRSRNQKGVLQRACAGSF